MYNVLFFLHVLNLRVLPVSVPNLIFKTNIYLVLNDIFNIHIFNLHSYIHIFALNRNEVIIIKRAKVKKGT